MVKIAEPKHSFEFLRRAYFFVVQFWYIYILAFAVSFIVIVTRETSTIPPIITGQEVLERDQYKLLQGAKVALVTNHTAQNKRGEHLVDLLAKQKGFSLVCILSPEHGFRGTAPHGEKVENETDPKTGIPIYSLYGATTRPTAEMLNGVTVIVYDIQDIGTRFYTYITTLGQTLEEAARRKIRLIVLDRPNPIRGDLFEGDVLDADVKRFTGYFPIPTRYGLTIGELAQWYNKTQNLKANLIVVPLENWKRHLWYDQTNLPFVPPSPNIPDLASAILYPGVACFEATNVSVGRGTETPFQLFGAPWIDATRLNAYLNEQNFPGVLFEKAEFTPQKDLYQGQLCHGVRLLVTDRRTLRPFSIFIAAFYFLMENNPTDFKPEWEEVRVVTGSNQLKMALEQKIPYPTLLSAYEAHIDEFRRQISPFFLYD